MADLSKLTPVLEQILGEHNTAAISIATDGGDLCVGHAILPDKAVTPNAWLQHASLSKTVASAFALEYFQKHGIDPEMPVNKLLASKSVEFRLVAVEGASKDWADNVTLRMLMDHSGLGQHYVYALDSDAPFPPILELLKGKGQYPGVKVEKEPGVKFGYSGGGFMVLQYIIEVLTGQSIEDATRDWLAAVGMQDWSFAQREMLDKEWTHGYNEKKEPYSRLGHFWFPPFGAGGMGTSRALMNFLMRLVKAFHDTAASYPLSHKTASIMLTPNPVASVQEGCMEFMNCHMGVGVFIAECGPNKVALHQAANEGYRGAYMVVFDGPDRGKGAVILSNGDNNATLANARAMQELLLQGGGWWQGLDIKHLQENKHFNASGLSQETIVNQGYKQLVFRAFLSKKDFDGPVSKRARM